MSVQPVRPKRITGLLLFLCALSFVAATPASARNSEDELGNWLIWNGAVRFSTRWSLFTEAQLRLYEVASNVNEVFVRAAGHYDVTKHTMVGVGYMRSEVWPFVGGVRTSEDRLYEQLAYRHSGGRPGFEHRFRLEQRWLEEAGTTRFRNRFRYRLQITTPLSRPKMEPRTHFFNFYNELFLNFGTRDRTFDQNRFYVAYGRQFTKHSNLQLGVLWQARTSADFFRLQVFYTHNFDLRDD